MHACSVRGCAFDACVHAASFSIDSNSQNPKGRACLLAAMMQGRLLAGPSRAPDTPPSSAARRSVRSSLDWNLGQAVGKVGRGLSVQLGALAKEVGTLAGDRSHDSHDRTSSTAVPKGAAEQALSEADAAIRIQRAFRLSLYIYRSFGFELFCMKRSEQAAYHGTLTFVNYLSAQPSRRERTRAAV